MNKDEKSTLGEFCVAAMPVRVWLAGQALPSIITLLPGSPESKWAEEALKCADAMLEKLQS